MLCLRPLSETISGQELIKEERVALLIQQCQRKFTLSEELIEATRQQLHQLDVVTLKELFSEILAFNTFEQFEQWITDRNQVVKPTRKRTRRKS